MMDISNPRWEYENRPIPTAEDELVARVKQVVGYVPTGTRDLLKVIAHPDVLPFTRAFLEERSE